MIKLYTLVGLVGSGVAQNTCSTSSVEVCANTTACEAVDGIWISVDNATYVPSTAIGGGRRYTLGQSDSEFTKTISAPNGGYCTAPLSVESSECAQDASACKTMENCMYRTTGAGRWFHSTASQTCVSNCSSPLVFCDAFRCGGTMGCSWMAKTQSSEDACFCIDNPGIFGNPLAPPKLTWAFWDQPLTLPVLVLAIMAACAIAYNVWLFNVKPFFRRILTKKPDK